MRCRQRPGAKCSRVDPNKSLGGGPYPSSLARPMTSEHPPGRRRSAANYGGKRRKFPSESKVRTKVLQGGVSFASKGLKRRRIVLRHEFKEISRPYRHSHFFGQYSPTSTTTSVWGRAWYLECLLSPRAAPSSAARAATTPLLRAASSRAAPNPFHAMNRAEHTE